VEGGRHHLAQAVVGGAVFDEQAVAQEAGDRIGFDAPAKVLAIIHQDEARSFRAGEDDRLESGERQLKDVAEASVEGSERRE
jgi:hypothetical protein